MAISTHVPMMKKGHTFRNIGVLLVYLVAFPLTLLALPFWGFVTVALNRHGAADALSESALVRLPGISSSRWLCSVATFSYLVLIVFIVIIGIGVITPPTDDPVESSSMSRSTTTRLTEARPQTTTTATTNSMLTTTTKPTPTSKLTTTTTTPTPTLTTTSTTTKSTTTSTTTEVGGQSSNIVVWSVHEDADGNDHENLNAEYITLKNTGGKPADMGGWTLSDSADHSYMFPSRFTLGPDETVTIYTGTGSNSASSLYWGSSSAVWNNGGDTIIVISDSGEIIARHEY